MSASVAKEAAMSPPVAGRTRHGDDLYTWVQEQVALLRAGRLDEVDAENVAEELADVGASQYAALESAFVIVLLHMLKWDHQPERRSRSWDNSIEEHRDRIRRILRDNPGLKGRLGLAVEDAYRTARIRASTEMRRDRGTLPASCPFSQDDIMNRECRWAEPTRSDGPR